VSLSVFKSRLEFQRALLQMLLCLETSSLGLPGLQNNSEDHGRAGFDDDPEIIDSVLCILDSVSGDTHRVSDTFMCTAGGGR
jgi:hypothetical protein